MGNEQAAPRHEPPRPEIVPSRPALTRTRSVQNRLSVKESRYLPKALTQPRDKSGLPPRYSSSNDTANDLESPQWGVSTECHCDGLIRTLDYTHDRVFFFGQWYIRTTPPTPEMYYSRAMSKNHSSGSTISAQSLPVTHPNPIFQGLQDKNRTSPMDFPSVPL
jgi:hypothetical protein